MTILQLQGKPHLTQTPKPKNKKLENTSTMKNWTNVLRHIIACAGFIIISLGFFYPILQGKQIMQSDIVQYQAMVKERNDLRENKHIESYWNDSAFGGMPTYQLGAKYPYDFIKDLDRLIRFLPRPADYLFLYFIGFYILLLCLKVDYRVSFIGAIAFGFSTYLIIILGVGHNAKAHAIGYFPLVLSGILLVFQKRYLWGGLLSALSIALEIHANHYQMTYYLLILCLIITIFQGMRAVIQKQIKSFFKAIGILLLSAVMAVWVNATALLATAQYASFSTRGTSTLSINPDGSTKQNKGLSKDYITEYSYGLFESFDLIVPRLLGGSNHEKLNTSSHTYNFLTQRGVPEQDAENFVNQLPTYWGNQPIVAAPAYIGIIVFFLFILGIFIVRNRFKWAFVIATIVSLVLSWGKNIPAITDFMIDYFPLYDKFRAVSSIQVILELSTPVLGFMALHTLIKNQSEKKNKALLYTFCISVGTLLMLWAIYPFLDFTGSADAIFEQYYGKSFVNALSDDRKTMYLSDIFRSTLLLTLCGIIFLLNHYKKITQQLLLIGLFILISIDMIGIAQRYIGEDNFVSKKQLNSYFKPSSADNTILKDTTRYRVFEPEIGINGARTSYFHHSIGGYHAAKPRYLQDIFDFYIQKNNPKNALNLLNVKYLITRNPQGKPVATLNEEALGNAWFIEELLFVKNDDQALQTIGTFNPKTQGVIVHPEKSSQHFTVSKEASIRLISGHLGKLSYESYNPNDGFVIFSEMYYPHGWNVTIDGTPVKMYRTDYLLRGIYLPKGKHTINFEFTPQIIHWGSYLTLSGNILLGLMVLLALAFTFKHHILKSFKNTSL